MKRLIVALLGAGVVASAAVVVGGTAHAVPANICVNANGTTYLIQGTAQCPTAAGAHSHAVAIGDGAFANGGDSNKNTAVSLGANSTTTADTRSNKDAAVVHGSGGTATAAQLNRNSAISTGSACTAGPTTGNKQTNFCQ